MGETAGSTRRGGCDVADERWDVVVVGSGPGGLTAGACLAAAGRRVLVLEAHDLAGGNTQVFRRHHKTPTAPSPSTSSTSACTTSATAAPAGCSRRSSPGSASGDRMHFLPLDPDGFDTLHFPDLTFVVPAGLGPLPGPADRGVPRGPRRHRARASARSTPSPRRAAPAASRAWTTPTFDQWAFRPLSELFAEGELSQRCQAVLDHWSGLYAGGPVADHGADARLDHRPLHARRLLPRGRRADDPRPAHPGDRGERRRGAHAHPGASDRGRGPSRDRRASSRTARRSTPTW